LLIFLPNLLWNIHHHWPFLELMRNIRESGKDVVLSPAAFLAQQVLLMSPMNFPFWFGGLLFLFFSFETKPYRVFAWAFVITISFFLLAHGKNYYAAPGYPMVLAAGGLAVERFFAGSFLTLRPTLRGILKRVFVLSILIGTLGLLPVVLPILPVDSFLRYQEHLPFAVPRSEHSHMAAALPQHYADEFGWEETVAAVASVYNSLSPEERAKTAIFGNNYGQAGAIDFFGPKYGLPKAICPHQSYFLWGPREYTGEIMIVIGSDGTNDRRFFQSVAVAATLNNRYALSYETRPILLCRGLNQNLQTLWPELKNWH
jgi:hypothetical protein